MKAFIPYFEKRFHSIVCKDILFVAKLLVAGFQRIKDAKRQIQFSIRDRVGFDPGFDDRFAGGNDDKNKRPKNTGILTVKTTPIAYPVRVDGQVVGMSGVDTAAEFYLRARYAPC